MQKEQSSQVRQSNETTEYDDKTLSQEHRDNIYQVILTALVEPSTIRH